MELVGIRVSVLPHHRGEPSSAGRRPSDSPAQNTPIGTVLSNASQSLPVAFRLKDGQVAFDTLDANTPYALVRRENGGAVLRRWKPGVGYAEAQVSVDDVHWKD